MATLFLQHIHKLITLDDGGREFDDGAVFIRDGVIEQIGATAAVTEALGDSVTPDQVIDLKKHIVIPGLINTHHHMFQSLTRVMAQTHELFDWLRSLYPIWSRITSQEIYTSAKLAMAELMLSGCTTSSDHLYLFPNDVRLEDEIRAAREIGMRFHAARGAMSLGESKGGLPPDTLVEGEESILKDMRRVIEAHHDKSRGAMIRVVVAPCSPFTVSQDLMRESAALARSYGVHLHTHLAETKGDVAYSLEHYGLLPGDYANEAGWVGADVWHAHCVCLNDREIGLFARTGTGVAHCPTSNMRLASGIAPIRKMIDARVKVGLGVDGSASNDGGHLLNEARMALMLQRVGGDPAGLSAREALTLATRGGASVLGRDDVGYLAPGMSADLAAFRLDHPTFAGAQHDPLAALVFCQPPNVDLSVINGRVVIEEGHFKSFELPALVEQHNALSRRLIRGD
ncbi:MAG: 8-oxoguanine deaminase [Anaerolineae bacterium]|nr:8-oxoguanine deaminase [Anaerolineae bacterium]NUQ05263.1 8-oxoguanine deaminase [Anaerolineae bacterium]